jgi:hypothetical protein
MSLFEMSSRDRSGVVCRAMAYSPADSGTPALPSRAAWMNWANLMFVGRSARTMHYWAIWGWTWTGERVSGRVLMGCDHGIN